MEHNRKAIEIIIGYLENCIYSLRQFFSDRLIYK